MCRVWRCAMGIAAGQVVWAPLCRGDLRLARVARVPRVALCHGDCCWAGRVGAALPWGSAPRARRACTACGAVPWGLLLGRSCGRRSAVGICVSRVYRVWCCAVGICVASASASRACTACGGSCGRRSAVGICVSRVYRVWRCAVGICVSGASRGICVSGCAMGIAAGRVAWVPLCHGDCYWACRMCGAVPWGLLLGVSRGWRCAMGIAAGRVVYVALCHCCWACRVGGAVPWGLLLGVSRVRRCAMVIAGGRVTGAALCHGDCWCVSRGWRRVLGIADQGLVWVAPVPWGLLLGVSRRWRCAMGIAAGRVRVGGAVPWGLLLGVSRVRRCAMGIAAQRARHVM